MLLRSEPPAGQSPAPAAAGSDWRRRQSRLRHAASGRTARGLALLLGLAAALRLIGIQYGLPFGNLLNPDEQNIVPRAWGMTHGHGLDPHWFDYPSLLLYVLAPFQAWQDEPSQPPA